MFFLFSEAKNTALQTKGVIAGGGIGRAGTACFGEKEKNTYGYSGLSLSVQVTANVKSSPPGPRGK